MEKKREMIKKYDIVFSNLIFQNIVIFDNSQII